MKNYIIILLVAVAIFFGSIIFKNSKINNFSGFPLGTKYKELGSEKPLFVFVFFSRTNCKDCMGIIKALNFLKEPFHPIGIVPPSELKNESELREISGAKFELIPFEKKYDKFHPNMWPCIFGVAANGNVLFVIPGIPESEEYLFKYINDSYPKIITII